MSGEPDFGGYGGNVDFNADRAAAADGRAADGDAHADPRPVYEKSQGSEEAAGCLRRRGREPCGGHR